MDVVGNIKANTKDLYSIRDTLGANKAKVYRLTRTWREAVGRGLPVDTQEQVLPSPRIVNLEHRRMVTGHGETTGADLLLRGLLQLDFPTEQMLDNKPESPRQEVFWRIGDRLYICLLYTSPSPRD